MILPEDHIRRIAMDTAEDIFGPSAAVSLDLSVGPDWSGELSYFLDFTMVQDRDRALAQDRRLRLRSDIHDRLASAGDDIFPYVRVLNRVAALADG